LANTFAKGEAKMPIRFGVPELLIILVIIILLFGVGRIGKVAGELGKGIKSFKDGLQGDKKD
jgi:sec-independent protein translocase protein TatA